MPDTLITFIILVSVSNILCKNRSKVSRKEIAEAANDSEKLAKELEALLLELEESVDDNEKENQNNSKVLKSSAENSFDKSNESDFLDDLESRIKSLKGEAATLVKHTSKVFNNQKNDDLISNDEIFIIDTNAPKLKEEKKGNENLASKVVKLGTGNHQQTKVKEENSTIIRNDKLTSKELKDAENSDQSLKSSLDKLEKVAKDIELLTKTAETDAEIETVNQLTNILNEMTAALAVEEVRLSVDVSLSRDDKIKEIEQSVEEMLSYLKEIIGEFQTLKASHTKTPEPRQPKKIDLDETDDIFKLILEEKTECEDCNNEEDRDKRLRLAKYRRMLTDFYYGDYWKIN